MLLNENQVKAICYNAGFRGTALNYAVEIARCESSFNTNAHNTSGEDSRGLFQINVSPGANPQYSNLDLFNPAVNAAVAYQIFKNNENSFRRWTCAVNLGLQYPEKLNNTVAVLLFATMAGIVLYLT